jgi:hypothetical protein
VADEQSKTRIILQGNEQDLRAEITSLLAFRQLIQGYEFGHFVGYPIADYVRMTNENIKLTLRYETNKQPPWRPNENTYLPRPTYSIPNVATSKINWKTIKDAMGGKNGYDWGHWRVAAMLKSKRTVYCFGNTAKEAQKRVEKLLELSNDEIEKITYSELSTSDGKPRHQAKKVYPAFFTVINNNYDRSRVRNNKPPRPKTATIALWVEDEPPDTQKAIQNVLSNKFDYGD